MNPNSVYLVQTDTTVGFSSNDKEKLAVIKKRPKTQKILRTVDSFKTLQNFTRIPNNHKKRVRNSKNSTFIYPNNESFRVISKDSTFYDFIKKFNVLYSSSANETQKNFDEEYAKDISDVVVIQKNGFFEDIPSKLYKINKFKVKKLR
jgi:tRNA A37 threonylcarbamoyladenosine synthetase subunit TsaC/SUA5/YrdC